MKIKCDLICQVTELFKGGRIFEVELYDARAYVGEKDFKVEYRLRISRINNKQEKLETLKETDWFVKKESGNHYIYFAGIRFVYLIKEDQIVIERDWITI